MCPNVRSKSHSCHASHCSVEVMVAHLNAILQLFLIVLRTIGTFGLEFSLSVMPNVFTRNLRPTSLVTLQPVSKVLSRGSKLCVVTTQRQVPRLPCLFMPRWVLSPSGRFHSMFAACSRMVFFILHLWSDYALFRYELAVRFRISWLCIYLHNCNAETNWCCGH
jgi:hypothetical protein